MQDWGSSVEKGITGLLPGKILAVDDDLKALQIIQAALQEAGFDVLTAASGAEALGVVRDAAPDLVLLDLKMPGMSGREMLQEMKSQQETGNTPVVIVTGVDQKGDKEEAVRAGADDFLAKPIEQRELLIRIQALLKVKQLHRDLERTLKCLHELEASRYVEGSIQHSTNGPLGTILIVEDELLERAIYADLLRDHGYEVLTVSTAPRALELLRLKAVDLILVDLVLPGMSGPELINRLKTVSPETPVVVVTAHPSSHYAVTALKLGAFDFIVKGFKNEVMLHAVRRALEKRQIELQTRTLLHEIKTKVDRLIDQQV